MPAGSVTLGRTAVDKFMNFCKISHSRSAAIFFLVIMTLVWVATPACSSRQSQSMTGARPQEIPAPAAPPETVTIDGTSYVIPPPWSGNRYTAPKFDFTDFQRIPVEYTHEESKVYILERAHHPLVELMQAAEKDGVHLRVESAYRSAGYQKRIFKRMLAEGRTFEDIVRYVAPPGYSEHMLGTAVDFFPSNWRFADTEAYAWLRANGERFGFEESYSRLNPLHIPWEAWHWNYTGEKRGYRAVSDLQPAGTAKKK